MCKYLFSDDLRENKLRKTLAIRPKTQWMLKRWAKKTRARTLIEREMSVLNHKLKSFEVSCAMFGRFQTCYEFSSVSILYIKLAVFFLCIPLLFTQIYTGDSYFKRYGLWLYTWNAFWPIFFAYIHKDVERNNFNKSIPWCLRIRINLHI